MMRYQCHDYDYIVVMEIVPFSHAHLYVCLLRISIVYLFHLSRQWSSSFRWLSLLTDYNPHPRLSAYFFFFLRISLFFPGGVGDSGAGVFVRKLGFFGIISFAGAGDGEKVQNFYASCVCIPESD